MAWCRVRFERKSICNYDGIFEVSPVEASDDHMCVCVCVTCADWTAISVCLEECKVYSVHVSTHPGAARNAFGMPVSWDDILAENRCPGSTLQAQNIMQGGKRGEKYQHF
jgi:hypothetical protein